MSTRLDETTLQGWKPAGSLLGLLMLMAVLCSGCEVNSFFDPSKTGYFGTTPVTMPVLDRIAAIEPSVDLWGETTHVTAADLAPSDLSYRIHPGDVLEARIFELYAPGEWFPVTLRVDQAGFIHVPVVGLVRAAGLTMPEVQEALIHALTGPVMKHPTVSVNLMEGGALTYIIYGHVQAPGRFTLQDPGLRLLDALTMAGGVPLPTRRIYVVRQEALAPELEHSWSDPSRTEHGGASDASPPVDLESLINRLQNENAASGAAPVLPSPGAWARSGDPPIDVEDLSSAGVKLPKVVGSSSQSSGGDSYVYLADSDKWVKARQAGSGHRDGGGTRADETSHTGMDLVLERVIEVPYQRLSHGDTSLNLVIRPGDQIYVDGPPVGYVYVSGEVNAPNAYPLPAADPITLSRLIAMAGGLGALAIPDRIDLVRQIDEGREATIRLDLAAIRRRTEPDVIIKPNDHILVGTNWFAYPLAVIRNGFRMNYGFGFLLDRNFGNDVFGPPPTNIGR